MGMMGGFGTDDDEVDVSAVGTLVWVRRPNGSWWPGRVLHPRDVPPACPAPPRSPATPIMLLGRRHGPLFVDWCNLERTKRVKPFRSQDLHFQHSIRKAQQLAARRRTTTSSSSSSGRYARKDDAILQALHIETTTTTTSINHPNRKRKRRTPNDSDDDLPHPHAFRRMRDLTDIGIPNAPPPPPSFSRFNFHHTSHLKTTSTKHSHRPTPTAAAKRNTTILDHDQPCGISRKKDRSRPLSELCNGHLFKSNAPRTHQHFMDMGASSGTSSAASSLDTLLDKSTSRRTGLFNADRTKPTEINCMTRLLHHGDELVDAPLSPTSTFKADHLHASQPCASTKDPIWKCNKQARGCSKAGISSRCDTRNSKMKTISSVDHDGSNRTRNALELECEHRKARVVKYKAPSNEVVILEERMEKNSVDKTATPDDSKDLAVIPNDLDCDDAVLQQPFESKREHEEPSETISNHSNCDNVSVSSLVFELPLQVSPPQQREPAVASCHPLKPIKTLQLNSALYDVELSVQGCSSNKGRHVPLVSLMSRWNRRPVVGYPVSVEVLDVVCCPPASSIDDHHPSTTSGNGLQKKDEAAVTHCARPSSHKDRAKPRGRRKTSEDEMDKSWRPHTKKPVSSPRKMRRLSSFAMSHREGEDNKSVVGKFSGPTVACVPLRVVFSRINEALSYPVK